MTAAETRRASHADMFDIYTSATGWLENSGHLNVSETARFIGQINGTSIVEDHETPPVQCTAAFQRDVINAVVPRAKMLGDYHTLGFNYVPHYFYLGAQGIEYAPPFLLIQLHDFDDETGNQTCQTIRLSPNSKPDIPHYIDSNRQLLTLNKNLESTTEEPENSHHHLLRPSEALALHGIAHNLGAIRGAVRQQFKPAHTSWGP